MSDAGGLERAPDALSLEQPSDDLLAMISNDSPTDLPQSWRRQKGGNGLWTSQELFSVNGGGRNGSANGNHANGGSQAANGKLVPSAAPAVCWCSGMST